MGHLVPGHPVLLSNISYPHCEGAFFATQYREQLYSVFTCIVCMVSLCFHCFASESEGAFFM